MSLILTRKPDEAIVLTTPSGQIIKATVICVKGNQVRIAIDADKSVTVHREEIQRRIDRGQPRPAA